MRLELVGDRVDHVIASLKILAEVETHQIFELSTSDLRKPPW